MSAKRKVNEGLYKKIKQELKAPKDDKKIMQKYHLGQTAVRAIRRSWGYADYLARTSHGKKQAKIITLNPSPLPSRSHAQEQAFKAWNRFAITIAIVVSIVVIIAIAIIIRWVLSLFGI